ncbi:SPOR domain-containing protein [Allosphingosinicella humi]
MRIHSAFAAAFAVFALAAPAAADVKAGVDAWQAGDYVAAVREWRPFAEKGDSDAQFNMGQAYKLGRGVPPNLAQARAWFEKAAAKGHEQAQANLGLILFQEGDRARAMPWIEKAADRGDPRAQYILGTALFNGDLVGKDWPRAYALMSSAAAAGLPQAKTTLGQMETLIPPAEREIGTRLARQAGQPSPVAARSGAPRRVAASAAHAPPAPPKPASHNVTAKPTASRGGHWRVQLGAYGSPAAARSAWAALNRRIGALAGLQPSYEHAGKFTRLRAGPLESKAAANRLCAAAKAAGQACFPVAS